MRLLQKRAIAAAMGLFGILAGASPGHADVIYDVYATDIGYDVQHETYVDVASEPLTHLATPQLMGQITISDAAYGAGVAHVGGGITNFNVFDLTSWNYCGGRPDATQCIQMHAAPSLNVPDCGNYHSTGACVEAQATLTLLADRRSAALTAHALMLYMWDGVDEGDPNGFGYLKAVDYLMSYDDFASTDSNGVLSAYSTSDGWLYAPYYLGHIVRAETVQVPEPATLALFAVGMIGVGAARVRRSKR